MLALGVDDVERAKAFWCAALGYEVRNNFGGWTNVLVPPDGDGLKKTLHLLQLDLHFLQIQP